MRVPTARRGRVPRRAEAHGHAEAYSQASATHPLDRYVWGLEYIDAPIIRYRDGNADGDYGDEGDSLLYYLHDANFNVTGLVDKAETAVVERYMYEPYGDMKVLDADWGEDANNTSDFDNEVLYCGYRRDSESALYHVRNRSYHPTLGRWLSRDPGTGRATNQGRAVGQPASPKDPYGDGMNLYPYVKGNPTIGRDPMGLCNIGDRAAALDQDGKPVLAVSTSNITDPDEIADMLHDTHAIICAISWVDLLTTILSPNPVGLICPSTDIAKDITQPTNMKCIANAVAESRYLWVRTSCGECKCKHGKPYWAWEADKWLQVDLEVHDLECYTRKELARKIRQTQKSACGMN